MAAFPTGLLTLVLLTTRALAAPSSVACPSVVGASANAANANPTIRFAAADFPEAPNWAGRGDPRFPIWAAEQANQALAAFQAPEVRLDTILRGIAAARGALEAELHGADSDASTVARFGRFRFTDPGSLVTTIGFLLSDANGAAPNRLRGVADAILAANSELLRGLPLEVWRRSDEATSRMGIVDVDYLGMDGHLWQASTLVVNPYPEAPGLLIIRHPTGTNSRYIYSDALARAAALLRGETPAGRGREFDFGASMNAFFQAMPTYRGSAAIGRVFYAALGARLLGQKPRIPPDADLKAMYMRPMAYAQRFADGEL